MILYTLEILGTVIFALTGALKGTQKHLDIFGVVVLSCCVGVGGGILRDAIIGNTPVNALTHPDFFITSIVTGVLVFFFARYLKNRDMLISVLDAFGLGVFTFTGANQAAVFDLNVIGIVLSGTITAVGGGVIRDVLSGDVPPTVLRTDFYATATVLGGLLFCLLKYFELSFIIVFVTVFMFVTILRLIALHFKINLPKS